MTKMIGSERSEARLSVSWTSPVLDEPFFGHVWLSSIDASWADCPAGRARLSTARRAPKRDGAANHRRAGLFTGTAESASGFDANSSLTHHGAPTRDLAGHKGGVLGGGHRPLGLHGHAAQKVLGLLRRQPAGQARIELQGDLGRELRP